MSDKPRYYVHYTTYGRYRYTLRFIWESGKLLPVDFKAVLAIRPGIMQQPWRTLTASRVRIVTKTGELAELKREAKRDHAKRKVEESCRNTLEKEVADV